MSASTSALRAILAIGLAVAERAPVCVAMTSGTAVANLGPAVVEANYARVPLIVLSANRPYELLGTGANQTFEQLGYFGTQVRANISLGLAEEAPERMDALNAQWRSATCRVLVRRHGISHRQRRAGAVRHPAARAAGARRRRQQGNRSVRAGGPYRWQAVDATRRRSRSTSRWTSTSPRTPWSSPGMARACTPISPCCRRSPSRPRRLPRTRCTRSRCGWSARSRSSCSAARRCTGRCRRCWPTRRSRCTR